MSKFHVSQIETNLRTKYESQWDDTLRDEANLSRLLALDAVVRSMNEASDPTRLIEVVDGEKDKGIDAIGIDTTEKVVILAQAKWRQDGSGSMDLAGVLKFLNGVRSILGMRADSTPGSASQEAREGVMKLMTTPGAKLHLVTATTAAMPLSDEVQAPISELLSQINDLQDADPIATHTHLGQSELFKAIAPIPRVDVDIDCTMLDWGRSPDPQRMYYGRVNAAEVASWFTQHGSTLFADNIRVLIAKSEINDGIRSTIHEQPENFIYFNNGITIIARSIETSPTGGANRDAGVFRLRHASVVNGAQTVSTLGKIASTDNAGNLANAYVVVRCIEVPTEDEDLGRKITRYANTQNDVSSQDFAFLDEEQHRLKQELGALGYEYIIRSAETPKTDDLDRVIELRHAALALAAASPEVGHAVTAKREVSRLFTDTYKALFNRSTDPLRLARSVEVIRAVEACVDEIERSSEGIRAGIAVHGWLAISHIILREAGETFLTSPDVDLQDVLTPLPGRVDEIVDALEAVFPANSYPGNVFKNRTRVVALLQDAGLI